MGSETIAAMGAAEAARAIGDGAITSEELVRACLDRIATRDLEIHAFAYLDADYALEQARRADRWRHEGHALPSLHGVPVAIKDVIDTADMPTEHGSPLFAGNRPKRDATIVAALRDVGAIILGKTVTTEFALFHPGPTQNPRAPGRTPGGSSSGSAAAVADFMTPLALGTQTAGSVIRPAAYCGVHGFKPTYGLISRTGVLPQSPELDTVGMFARSVEDIALLADALTAYDPADSAMWPRSRSRLHDVAMQPVPAKPRFAFVRSPAWGEAEDVTRQAFAELATELGDRCEEIELPPAFDRAIEFQRTIQMAGVAAYLGPYQGRGEGAVSDVLSQRIEEGGRIPAASYIEALAARRILEATLDHIFNDFDAILTPATPGPAPEGISSTGSPVFCALWTYLLVPAITLPLLEADGLPMGVQLIGRARDDGRLLRTGRWLEDMLANAGETRATL